MLQAGLTGKNTFLEAFSPLFLVFLALLGQIKSPLWVPLLNLMALWVSIPVWTGIAPLFWFFSFKLNSLEWREVVIRRRKKEALRTTVKRDKDKRGFYKNEEAKKSSRFVPFILRGFWEKPKVEWMARLSFLHLQHRSKCWLCPS